MCFCMDMVMDIIIYKKDLHIPAGHLTPRT